MTPDELETTARSTGSLFERLRTELARHIKAVQEAMSTQISAIDDKYADLPARVSHLETAVFAPQAALTVGRPGSAGSPTVPHPPSPGSRSPARRAGGRAARST